MPLDTFSVIVVENGEHPIKTTLPNADDPSPLNLSIDLTNKVQSLEVHDESGIVDDRVMLTVADDGWRSNYPLSTGQPGTLRSRYHIYLSYRSSIRVTINGVRRGYEFDGMGKHPHRGLITLRGIKGFNGDNVAQSLLEFLDNGVLFSEEYDSVQRKPDATKFHIPKPTNGEDITTYIWRFHARWESMLGTLRWNEIIEDLGEETYSIVTGRQTNETLSTPTLGPYLASQVRNAERPSYREVVDILNKFGLRIYFGESPQIWRLHPIRLGRERPAIVPMEWTHNTIRLDDEDFIALSPDEEFDDAATMNDEWKIRELVFHGEEALEQDFNIQTGEFSSVTETPIFKSGEGGGNTYDVGDGQGITPEALGYVHIEAKRLMDALESRKLNGSITLSPELTPQTKVLNGDDVWIIRSVHHIIRIREGGAIGRTTLEMAGLPLILLSDLYREHPAPWNGEITPQLNEPPETPTVTQLRSFIEIQKFGQVPAYEGLASAEQRRIVAAGIYTEDGGYDINWQPDSSFLYVYITPTDKGHPLLHYDISLTDNQGREEHRLIQNPPIVPYLIAFDNILSANEYQISVKAVNPFGESAEQRMIDNAGGNRHFPTQSTTMRVPAQMPELTAIGYEPKKIWEARSQTGTENSQADIAKGGGLAESADSWFTRRFLNILSAIIIDVVFPPFGKLTQILSVLGSLINNLIAASEDGIYMEYVANGHGSPITDIVVEKRVRTESSDVYDLWSPNGNKLFGSLVTVLLPGEWAGVLSSTSGRFANLISGSSAGTVQKWARMDSLEDGVTADRVRQYRIGVETSQGTVYYYTEAMRERDFRRSWTVYIPIGEPSGQENYYPSYGETGDWGGEDTTSFYESLRRNGFVVSRTRSFNTEIYDPQEWIS